MAEFKKIMKIKERLCSIEKGCETCPVSSYNNPKNIGCAQFMMFYPEEAEALLLKWKEQNPELRMPTWEQAWNQLYPEAARATPCPRCLFSTEMWPWCDLASGCSGCMDRVISPEIAEKLGIKPLPAKEE